MLTLTIIKKEIPFFSQKEEIVKKNINHSNIYDHNEDLIPQLAIETNVHSPPEYHNFIIKLAQLVYDRWCTT